MSKGSSSSSGGGGTSSSSALHQLLSPDGYYTYLNVPRPQSKKTDAANPSFLSSSLEEASEVDLELIRKNYRRLSLLHHPDRRGGDAETFRVLSRAKKVLTTPKLRKEYDLLGLDLDDDEENEDHQEDANDDDSDGGGKNGSNSNGGSNSSSSSAESVMSHIASLALATILQMVVRTALLGVVSVLISRSRIVVVLISFLLLASAYRLYRRTRNNAASNRPGIKEFASLALILLGLAFMHIGRRRQWAATQTPAATVADATEGGEHAAIAAAAAAAVGKLPWVFWLGETLTMSMFIINSLYSTSTSSGLQSSPSLPVVIGVSILSGLTCLFIFKGRWGRYLMVILLQALLAVVAVFLFPVMELVLEEIINEKMKKVGEKVRQQGKRVDLLLQKKRLEEEEEAARREQHHGDD